MTGRPKSDVVKATSPRLLSNGGAAPEVLLSGKLFRAKEGSLVRKFLLPGKPGQEGERRVRATTRDDPEGMKSVSLVRVAQRIAHPLGAMTLLEVTIKTGRTHQIRVHLASSGHPIAGDEKYGDFERNRSLQKAGLKRMFLHAWRLRFVHPATGEEVQLEQPLEPALAGFVQQAGDVASRTME